VTASRIRRQRTTPFVEQQNFVLRYQTLILEAVDSKWFGEPAGT